MRTTIVASLLASMAAAGAGAEQAGVFREPYTRIRPVIVVAPPDDAPVVFDPSGTIALVHPLEATTLTVRVRSRHPEPLPSSGLVLRVGFGPMEDMMLTMRMQPRSGEGSAIPGLADVPSLLLPDTAARLIFFRVAADPPPPLAATRRTLRIVAVLERVTDAGGRDIWTNPDSREHIWEALRASTAAARHGFDR
jgi:hypothetical protein